MLKYRLFKTTFKQEKFKGGYKSLYFLCVTLSILLMVVFIYYFGLHNNFILMVLALIIPAFFFPRIFFYLIVKAIGKENDIYLSAEEIKKLEQSAGKKYNLPH